jgi:hypothetical protein
MKKFLALFIFSLIFCSCRVQTNFSHKGSDDIAGVYKVYMGKIDSLSIYIVDGETVRREIYSDFIFGGNEQRYPFVPHNEIWIDNSVSNREYLTTLKHEINEMVLMRDAGMTYIQAHDSSLMLEVKLRNDFRNESLEHEKFLPEVFVSDTDSVKQILSIPDKIKLNDIYLQKREIINYKFTVWLVDGDKIRREIYPDFGFDGDWNDYNFIPQNEIWIDGGISCEQYIYSVAGEKNFVELYSSSIGYDESIQKSDEAVQNLRAKIFSELAGKYVKVDRSKKLARDKVIK